MLSIEKFEISQPHLVGAGAIVFDARRDRPPMLVGADEEEPLLLKLERWGQPPVPFRILPMVVNLGPHLIFRDVRYEVDIASKISPTASDIPYGALCVEKNIWSICARYDHYTRYVSVRGAVMGQPSYDDFAAFGKWRVLIGEKEDAHILFAHDHALPPAAD